MAIIFVKNLKWTDVKKQLTIPSRSLNLFPPLNDNHTVDFHVVDESGRVWSFRIYTRKRNKYPKPAITKGWRAFVCSKELSVGDKVTFYMEEEQAGVVTYRVQVEKEVKIFGAIIGYVPIH
ncbi:hypothetical protein DITRI_Ditri08aG0164200 [Diplodiscus trichospermus]